MLSILLPLLAQLAPAPHNETVAEARLKVCIDQSRSDVTTAIATADDWLQGLKGSETSYPLQCLGIAYTRLMRWDAAEETFVSARDALLPEEKPRRARLGGMAANAALADGSPGAALALLDQARADATGAGDLALAGELEIDRARALVALDRTGEAEAALNTARRDAAQDPDAWLLSATLARRLGKLSDAQFLIETAARLNPVDPEVGLEAGVIAVLSGRDEAARKSWQSVIAAAPGSAPAALAKSYIDQLGGN